jgi:ketosteroid isomerase-like protein
MPDNIATVKRIYEAFGRGDVPAILASLAPEVRWEPWADNTAQRAGVPWMQAHEGPEAVAQFFAALAGWRITGIRVLDLMASADQVAVEFELDAIVNGRELREQEVHLWTFDGQGRVTRFRHYLDTAKHIALAGRRVESVGG